MTLPRDYYRPIAVRMAAFCARLHGYDDDVADDVRAEAIRLAHEFKAVERKMAETPASLSPAAVVAAPVKERLGEWCLIETAEKDGTAVWVYPVGIFGADQSSVAYWDRDKGYECWRDLEGERLDPQPSHWQPLPATPFERSPLPTTGQQEPARELKERLGEQDSTSLQDIFDYVKAMIDEGVKHRTKGFSLKEMTWDNQCDHLLDETHEVCTAARMCDQKEELCDVLGVWIHMAIYRGMTPKEAIDGALTKLMARFEIPANFRGPLVSKGGEG